ncbi:hypothetical protein Prudu_021516 [Prunus dulcis]|uniref:Mitochondrial transcription termination factor family protein n=1 Tax=Prunus dulcis TaxID=3755 RepID=A0A4Y1RZ61_PRUDU|nr:hypothetical protein Prudu_021516 [Prunus dulcis]
MGKCLVEMSNHHLFSGYKFLGAIFYKTTDDDTCYNDKDLRFLGYKGKGGMVEIVATVLGYKGKGGKEVDLVLLATPDVINAAPNIRLPNVSQNLNRRAYSPSFSPKKWVLHSTAEIENTALTDEERKTWEACQEAISAFSITIEEGDKILGKAFGLVHSPYWGEIRKKEVPTIEIVKEKLDYLRSLSLSDDDLCKLLKKFPEVLGCNLENELKTNVQVLEKEWGIKGKSLRNLLLRNPRVLEVDMQNKGPTRGPAKIGNHFALLNAPSVECEPSASWTVNRSKRRTSLRIPHRYMWHLLGNAHSPTSNFTQDAHLLESINKDTSPPNKHQRAFADTATVLKIIRSAEDPTRSKVTSSLSWDKSVRPFLSNNSLASFVGNRY